MLFVSYKLNLSFMYSAGEACSHDDFGRCSHYCTEDSTAPYGFSCSCAQGYILQIDGYTCLAAGEHTVVMIN